MEEAIMPRIDMIKYEELDAEGKRLYDEQVHTHGKITNMKMTLLKNKFAFKVMMEWYPMRDEVAAFLGDFATNVFAYSVSEANSCLICSTFFRKILKDSGRDPDRLVLDETESLVAEFGRALVTAPNNIDDTLFDKLKAKFTESQIIMLTTFGGMMMATNLVNNALQVTPDNYLYDYMKK